MTRRLVNRALPLAAAMMALATASAPTISATAASAQPLGTARDFAMPEILDLRRQAEVRDAWLVKRLDTVVPADTVWAIELNAERAVPEWGGRKVRFMLEEDACFEGREVRFVDGCQELHHLIPRQ